MIRASLLVSLMLLVSSSAKVQDTPGVELFGGYSYAGSGSNGFDVSVTGNVNDWFGLVADFGGQYTRLDDQGFTEKIRSHSILFGPRFSLRRSKRLVPFVHALFGVSHLKTETNEFGPLLSFSDTSFGMALGGGLDVRINDRVAIRTFQADYLRTSFFNNTQNKGRISVGIVLRLGRK
jgi:opacity protein-like surface antigen